MLYHPAEGIMKAGEGRGGVAGGGGVKSNAKGGELGEVTTGASPGAEGGGEVGMASGSLTGLNGGDSLLLTRNLPQCKPAPSPLQ